MGRITPHVQGVSGAGLLAQYLLDITATSTLQPVVTGGSLPQDGTTSTDDIDRFTLTFNEDLSATSANDPTHYDLREAGPDGAFDTADDVLYAVANQAYSSGSSASYLLTDGPLQPGSYRLTVSDLTDRFGNVQVMPYVLSFLVAPWRATRSRAARTIRRRRRRLWT